MIRLATYQKKQVRKNAERETCVSLFSIFIFGLIGQPLLCGVPGMDGFFIERLPKRNGGIIQKLEHMYILQYKKEYARR